MSIIKSFSVDTGDMFYIKHDSDNFTVIDCCMDAENQEQIMNEIEAESKGISRFISTHPDEDHIKGLEFFHKKTPISNFYCVANEATKSSPTDDFKLYSSLRDSEKSFKLKMGCTRKWLNENDNERTSAGIIILWPDTTNASYKDALNTAKGGGSPNNISPIIKYCEKNGVKVMWMGDLETDFMTKIESSVILESVDILFAPHHGRDSGKIPKSWLNKLKPKIIVIGEAPTEYINYYQGYNTITQNTAKDIIFDCKNTSVDIYVSNKNYPKQTYLKNNKFTDKYGCFYNGTLNL